MPIVVLDTPSHGRCGPAPLCSARRSRRNRRRARKVPAIPCSGSRTTAPALRCSPGTRGRGPTEMLGHVEGCPMIFRRVVGRNVNTSPPLSIVIGIRPQGIGEVPSRDSSRRQCHEIIVVAMPRLTERGRGSRALARHQAHRATDQRRIRRGQQRRHSRHGQRADSAPQQRHDRARRGCGPPGRPAARAARRGGGGASTDRRRGTCGVVLRPDDLAGELAEGYRAIAQEALLALARATARHRQQRERITRLVAELRTLRAFLLDKDRAA